jgi:hypothetical protein
MLDLWLALTNEQGRGRRSTIVPEVVIAYQG